MLSVDFRYADLLLPIRKGLASRHALLTLREAAWAANDSDAACLSRKVESLLTMLKVPIDSPNSDRLDTFVAQQLQEARRDPSKPLATIGVCCTACTGAASVACDGHNDVAYVEQRGQCILPIKECCDLAVRTMQRLYASVARTGRQQHAVVNFKIASVCPANAAYCVSGGSSYADREVEQVTRVTMHIGLEHWVLESYAALAVILAHELVCHAGHGLNKQGVRENTTAQDRYVEGWMDFVARSALLDELRRSQHELSPGTPLRTAQTFAVAGVIGAWRTADSWPGSCQHKRYDSAAPHRRYGEQRASEAQGIFDQLGDADAFFEFSAAFNAAATTKAERDDWLEDVDVVSCMIGGRQKHRVTRALEHFARKRDIDEFRRVWREGRP